eukprot:scaffold18545_cov32-Tisochrysis_lutea.AAC.2
MTPSSEEIANQNFSISFDGTTRLGEALNVTGRWCTSNFELVKRLLAFHQEARECQATCRPHHPTPVHGLES